MEAKPHILVILGSIREGRAGERVFAWLRSRLEDGTEMSYKFVDLRDMPLPFLYQEGLPGRGVLAPEAEAWSKQVDQADGFIFVSPEYNNSMPAVLKNAMDYLYREWNHKPGAIVSYGGWASGYRSAQHLRHVMIELKMVPIREQVGMTFIPGAAPNLDDGPGSKSWELLEVKLEALLAELAWWAVTLLGARRATA